jgi:protein TonB
MINKATSLSPWLSASLLLHLTAAGIGWWLYEPQQPAHLAGQQTLSIQLIDSMETRTNVVQAPTPETRQITEKPISSTDPQAPATLFIPEKTSLPPAGTQNLPVEKPLLEDVPETENTLASIAATAGAIQAPNAISAIQEASFHADYLHNPKPRYPTLSMRLGEQGIVLLHVHVNSQGQALDVNIKQSSGYARLDQAALDVVKQWQFIPARQGDTRLESWVDVPVQFSLEN